MRDIGLRAEQLAKKFLIHKGYRFVESNYTCSFGEIDLIFTDGKDQLVFVEVKARTSDEYGLPEEFVDSYKQEKLKRAALYYLQSKPEVPQSARFEIIGIKLDEDPPRIKHLKGLFF